MRTTFYAGQRITTKLNPWTNYDIKLNFVQRKLCVWNYILIFEVLCRYEIDLEPNLVDEK